MESHDLYGMAEVVARTFRLGTVLKPPARLAGGRAHDVYELSTDEGRFVVKKLNPALVSNPLFLSRLHEKVELEQAAVAAGISCPRPVTTPSGELICEIKQGRHGGTFRVHEWVNGSHPGWDAAASRVCQWVGESLAIVHTLARQREVPPRLSAPVVGRDKWRTLVEEARAKHVPWHAQLAEGLPSIIQAEALVVDGMTKPKELFVTHGELDQRNVLLDALGPGYIIDWDGLISWDRSAEVMFAALQWSGGNSGRPDLQRMRTLVQAYVDAGGTLHFEPRLIGWWFAWQLGWLWSSCRLALGHPEAPLDSHEEAAETRLLRKLEDLPQLLSACNEWADVLAAVV